MRKKQIFIFLSVFISLYSLINFYIFLRGYQGLEYHSELRLGYIIVFLFVSLSYFAGRFFEKRNTPFFKELFIWIGSFWFAFIAYFFLLVILVDLIRLVNVFGHFLPEGLAYSQLKFYVTISLIGLIGLI